MAVIVRRISEGGEFVLLGAGFGISATSRPGVFFGSLAPREDSAEVAIACVCDRRGNIGWIETDDLEVVAVDGQSPGDLLGGTA